MVGSVLGNSNTSGEFGQIYKIAVAKNGNVLFLDTQNGALYELQPGATAPITLSNPGDVLRGNQAFWNGGMALDANDTLYIGGIYNPQPDFYRVPYDPTTGTWPLTGSSTWAAGNSAIGGDGVNQIAFDDNDDMIITTETTGKIEKFSISADGSTVGAPGTHGASGVPTVLVSGLKEEAAKMAVDHAGNVYFIEDPWMARTAIAVGLWMIPAGTSGTVGEKSPVVRLDPPALNYNFKGVTVDAAGDLYLSSEIDTGGVTGGDGNFAGVLMVPNESGSPTSATASSLNWNHSVMAAPVTATAPVAIDPRGFLWIPTPTSGWAPVNSTEGAPPVYPGSMNWVVWALGNVNLGASPIGTAGTTGSLYFTFNSDVTPAKIVSSQAGAGSDFTVISTNPVMNPGSKTSPATVDTTVIPCTAGTAYTAGQSCPYWIAVNPTVAGTVSGQVQFLDSKGNVIAGSTAYLYGAGQGPEASLLGSPAATQIGSAFTKPEQIAVDSLGNTYVADAGQGKVLQYAAGATTAVSIGSGLKSPTGVAVDGNGNVYIGDSGQILEVPYQSGALNSAGQVAIQTGLGNNLNLAVDGAGNVYVADQDNAQVVKVSTPTTKSMLFSETLVTAGGGFKAPSAVAVDPSGDVFIADGENLDEVTFWGGQSTITTKLAGPVTGLALDASGSVYVAQSGGLIRIPSESGVLTFNDRIGIAASAAVTPAGVTLDRTGNLYVSYTGTNGVASVASLGVNGNYAFGTVTPLILTTADTQLFNIGNLPLTIGATADDVFTGTNAADFSVQLAGDAPPCDPSTPTAAGQYCFFGFGVMPSVQSGTENGSLAIQSNASNASTVNLAITDNPVVDNRPTTTTVISPIGTLTYPGTVTITVTVSSTAGTPVGTVNLSVSNNVGKSSQSLDANGVATFTFSNLQGGSYNVNATYTGYGTLGTAPDFAVSAAKQATFIVSPAVPNATVTTPATYLLFNGTNSITATVVSAVGVPTGTVAFMNGSQLADPAQLPITLSGLGTATFNTSKLAHGTYNLTAVYSGDENYAAVTIPISTFQVIDQSVLITAAPSSLTVTPGVPGSVTLTLQGLVGFGGPGYAVSLACITTTLPQYSECSFDNTSIEINPSDSSATVVLTISTNVPVNSGSSAAVKSGPAPWALAGMFGFGLLGLAFGKKTRFNGRALTIICLMLLFVSAAFGVSACSNSGYTHTPPSPVVTTPAGSASVQVTTTYLGKVNSLPYTLPVTVN
jgi:sugar lactone lactonase YvrE